MANEFHSLLLECLPRLRAFAIVLTRNKVEAEDLLQETACRALQRRDQFTMGTNFRAWIYRILRNEFISRLRQSKGNGVCIDDLPDILLARDSTQEDQRLTREVISALGKLSPSQRELLLLVCVEGFSYEHIAVHFECSLGTVKSRMHRARRQMQVLVMGEDESAVSVDTPHARPPVWSTAA